MGVASRILLCPPDLPPAHLPQILRDAEATVAVSDGSVPALMAAAQGLRVVACSRLLTPHPGPLPAEEGGADTEWVLFTSGTTGAPKLVLHTLASLTGPLQDGLVVPSGAVWSTFYDVRRYGGLTILLRALIGGGSMVLSRGGRDGGGVSAIVQAGAGVTHISGTPSHWRRALMSPAAGTAWRLVMCGCPARLLTRRSSTSSARAYAGAEVAHAFASTEAGVGVRCARRAGGVSRRD